MDSRCHKIKFVFALLILSSLFVPVVVQITGVSQIDDEQFRNQEKRDRVRFEINNPFNSNLLVNLKTLEDLPNQIDSWFNDNFGLRNELIDIYAKLQYEIFGRSIDTQRIVTGKHGFLFLGDKSENVLKQSMNVQYFNSEQLRVFVGSLQNIETYLNREGIAFLFVIAPNKHSIYPEYLPERFKKRKKNTIQENNQEYKSGDYSNNVYDQIAAKLNNSNISFVELKTILIDAKEKYGDLLYYRTDSHWSNVGAYIAYKAIMDNIKTRFNHINISEMVDYAVDRDENGYDLSNMAHLSWMNDFYADIYFADQIGTLEFHDLKKGRKWNSDKNFGTQESPQTDINKEQTDSTQDYLVATHEYLTVTNPEAKNTYRVLVFRDSFCNALSRFFNRSFREITYINHDEITKTDFSINEMVRKIKPDIVIFEVAERFLMYKFHQLFSVDNLLNIRDYKIMFDADGESLVDINGNQLHKNICAKSKDIQSLNIKDNSVVISSSGDDPFIEIQKFNAVDGQDSVFIKVDLEAPEENDTMQIFYQTTEQTFFSELRSVSFSINKGQNTIYGKIDDISLNGVFRIDLGRNRGIYRLNSLTVRSKPQ
ncbi:MAG: hypothetical protein HQK73_01680 [Desulfamplus sp.]|nr:hypothetical protein [Desulfamplus sp.]